MPSSHDKTLGGLPQEIFDMISGFAQADASATKSDHGSPDALPNLRLVSREISQKVESAYLQEYFSDNEVMIDSPEWSGSLARAIQVAESPLVGASLRKLSICIHEVHHPDQINSVVKEQEPRLSNGEPWTREPVPWRNSEKEYAQLVRLFKALAKYQTLKELVVVCEGSTWEAEYFLGSNVKVDIVPDLDDSSDFSNIVRALATSQLTIAKFSTETFGCYNWCLPAYFFVADKANCASFAAVLETVKDLRIDLWFPKEDNDARKVFFQLLAAAQKLELLEIKVRDRWSFDRMFNSTVLDRYGYDDMLIAQSPSFGGNLENPCEALLKLEFPLLKQLAVRKSMFVLQELSNFIERHAKLALTKLVLDDTVVTVGEKDLHKESVKRQACFILDDEDLEDQLVEFEGILPPADKTIAQRLRSMAANISMEVSTHLYIDEYRNV